MKIIFIFRSSKSVQSKKRTDDTKLLEITAIPSYGRLKHSTVHMIVLDCVAHLAFNKYTKCDLFFFFQGQSEENTGFFMSFSKFFHIHLKMFLSDCPLLLSFFKWQFHPVIIIYPRLLELNSKIKMWLLFVYLFSLLSIKWKYFKTRLLFLCYRRAY